MPDKKILVADDDPGIVDAMQILLEDEGYNVITTMDGGNIIRMYEQKPDLVFLDIWMSGINGSTICEKLKADPQTSDVPIILFSANRDTAEIAMQCGADGFLSKPFEIKELIAIVRKYTGE
ncbi:MAG: response regulator receiver protein [Chitinophagaceae bacterium]|nr:response regulator receiver protein [Chitinophagaceae bacterium]